MNPLPIEYQKMQSILHERIDNVLSVNPTKIKKFKNGSVKVNQYLITNSHDGWKVRNKSFFRRKSAVGYAICLVNNNKSLARQVETADQKLLQHKSDVDTYFYHMTNTQDSFKKEVFSARISHDMPLVNLADSQLTSILKTIQV